MTPGLKYGKSPTCHDHAITYVQAYNSAAKMAHPLDLDATACYLLCRGFTRAITQDTRGRNFAKASAEIKQHLHDLLTFTHSYIREKCTLRIEEVITIDAFRHHIPTQLEELEVIVSGTTTLLTKALFENYILYKMFNWRKYELCIKRNFDILRETVYSEPSSDYVLMPYNKITQAMRAEIRLNYFVHGDNVAYGYQLMRSVFLRGTANHSVSEGIVQLRAADEDNDNRRNHIPIFCRLLPYQCVQAICYIWDLIRIWSTNDPLEFMSVAYAI